MTSGLEPCSPHSQCGTLPVKLKPTFDVEAGFEPTPSVSKTDMLNHYTTQQSFLVWENNVVAIPGFELTLPLYESDVLPITPNRIIRRLV